MQQKLTIIIISIFFPIILFAQLGVGIADGIADGKKLISNENNEIRIQQQNIIQNPEAVGMAVPASERFYVNHKAAGNSKYISYLQNTPAVSTVLRAGLAMAEDLNDGTMDMDGNWWAVNSSGTFIYKIDKTNGTILRSVPVPVVGANQYQGIAYNPVDRLIYFIKLEAFATVFYTLDPNDFIMRQVGICNGVSLFGLACSKEGLLYSINGLQVGFPLISFNPKEASSTVIGNTTDGSFQLDNFVDMEADQKTNSIYLMSQNFKSANSTQLRRVSLTGPSAGACQLIHDFGTTNVIRGLAFDFLSITAPTAGTVAYSNKIYNIEWIGGRDFTLKIELSTNGGANWSTIESAYPSAGNSYAWTVPQANSTSCKIRITNNSSLNISYTSQQFEINTPFQIVTGNSGENWPTGSDQTVSWYQDLSLYTPPLGNTLEKKGAAGSTPDYIMVEIAYSLNGMAGPWTIAGVVPSYDEMINIFKVNLPSVATDRGLFRISSEAAAPGKAIAKGLGAYSFTAYSTRYFSLYQLPTNNGKLAITSPNGGESYKSGSFQTLQWRKKGILIGSLLLEYTTDNGQSWNKINTNPVSGSVSRYNWVVPNTNSVKCFVRISNSITKELYDISDNGFAITPAATQSEAANFPNPFNPSTRIIFGLDKSSFTSLKVYNSIGQQVSELVNRQLEAGTHEFEFNASKLPSGVYYYNLSRDGKSEIHKMLLIK